MNKSIFKKPTKPLYIRELRYYDDVQVVYGIDIDEIQIGVQIQARKYESFSYNSFADEQYNAQSPDTPAVISFITLYTKMYKNVITNFNDIKHYLLCHLLHQKNQFNYIP
ncbi:hypothetical protein PL373_14375 [Tenacibaculum maritimum]|nr:hypothetical protein [Tenacibaculum maritimum]MDB0602304.1 hypothetical protein [Tenacibaculum maritimum]MDB0612440.1 hypothetical protein [Tenacibaculum maritimum]